MATNELAPPKELKDSSALVVGGTAGIGLATAVGLARAGAPRIMIVGRNADRGRTAAEFISSTNPASEVTFLSADATTVDGAAHIAAEAERILDGVDILMSTTAADTRPELFANIPTADIARAFNQLALPCMYLASEIVPHMTARKSGVIINLASDAGKTATPGESV